MASESLFSSGEWYLVTAEWLKQDSPTRKHRGKESISYQKEKEMRMDGCAFIVAAAAALQMQPKTTATAALYFHIFYNHHCFQSEPKNRNNLYRIASTCLCVAGKVHNEAEHRYIMDDVSAAWAELLKKHKKKGDDPSGSMQKEQPDLRKKLKQYMTVTEYDVLDCVDYNFTVPDPFSNFASVLVKLFATSELESSERSAKKTKIDNARKLLMKMAKERERLLSAAWRMLLDIHLTPMCVMHTPTLIAVAVLYLVLLYQGLRLKKVGDGNKAVYQVVSKEDAAEKSEAEAWDWCKEFGFLNSQVIAVVHEVVGLYDAGSASKKMKDYARKLQDFSYSYEKEKQYRKDKREGKQNRVSRSASTSMSKSSARSKSRDR